MYFQDLILALQNFWAKRGCLILQPYNSEVGAGTFNPATFLRALGPEPWNVAYVEPSRRPTDVRYGENPNRTAGSSIYGAVQNMCLATRALGLGTTLTTRHTGYGKEVDAIFGLPPGVQSYAILPIGWPMGRFGPLGRGPLKDVVFQDTWGKPYQGL